ncbi:MAG: hypothetical protein ACP6IP_03230 [Candidatus Njordarchaeia archaeon]
MSFNKYVVYCPKCNKNLDLTINRENLEYTSGVAKVAIFHGDPPHSLIVYITEGGKIAGTEVAEFTVLLIEGQKVTREIRSKISSHVGLRTLVPLYCAYIANEPYYILTDVKKKIIKNFAEELFSDFPAEFPIDINIVAEQFCLVIIDQGFFEAHEGS